jgi:hypothetical protein
VNSPPINTPPSTWMAIARTESLGPAPGLKVVSRVPSAFNRAIWLRVHPVNRGEIAADENPAAIDGIVGGIDGDGIHGAVGARGIKSAIHGTVIIELGDVVEVLDAVDAGEAAADEDSAIGGVGRRTGKGLGNGIDRIVRARAGVEGFVQTPSYCKRPI